MRLFFATNYSFAKVLPRQRACDVTWHRVLEAGLTITPMQQTYMESVLRGHLLRQVRRGERKVTRLASRGVFLICGILA
ncbi:MAG: hypothetical protein WB005_15900, partial [Pseudolabrys sp.]